MNTETDEQAGFDENLRGYDKPVSTLAKIALLPEILKAAQLLAGLGLLEREANEYVKQYVLENPDINRMLNRP